MAKVTELGQKIMIALSQLEHGEYALASQIPELLGDFHMRSSGLGRSASVLVRRGLVVATGETPNRYALTDDGRDLVDSDFGEVLQ